MQKAGCKKVTRGYIPVFLFSLLLVCSMVILSLPRPALAASENGQAGRLIIKFRDASVQAASVQEMDNSVKAMLSTDLAGQVQVDDLGSGTGRVKVSGNSLQKVKDQLAASGAVEYVEEDQVRKAFGVPNDPEYYREWHLPAISADAAWDVTQGSASTIIAVIDTGVDYTHPDLSPNVVQGYNFVANNTNAYDDNGHGTHVSGIAAAVGNNGYGIAGVDWNARIMPLKVLDAQGSGYDSDVARAIRYAADKGADVISMSLGGGGYSQTLQDAINYAYQKGLVIVAAAGNDGTNLISYPAAMDNVISVAALDSSDNLASFSNYGQGLDISAPGLAIYSTVPGGFATYSGTSMATPVVSGTAALVLGRHPDRSPGDITQMLFNSATDLGGAGYDTRFGYGKVNAYAALDGSSGIPPGQTPTEPPPQVTGGANAWYLAEGYTGPGFSTYVLIQNPNSSYATFRADFMAEDGRVVTHYYVLEGQTRMTLDLSQIIPNASVSTHIVSTNDVGVVVERSMYFNYGGRTGGHAAMGAVDTATSWYFPEGFTSGNFDEYVLVLNPNSGTANVTLNLLFGGGGIEAYTYRVDAHSRFTIHVNDLQPDAAVSARVDSDKPVVAERAMYFDYFGIDGGSDSMGVSAPSSTWYFPEGCTNPGFDEYILLMNPEKNSVTATLLLQPEGGGTLTRYYTLAPESRTTLHINEILPNVSVAARVTTPSSVQIVAEQAMYFSYAGAWADGSTTMGATTTSSQWCIPEGYTGAGFDTWLLIQNTDPTQASDVTVYTMQRQGSYQLREFSIAPGGRYTIKVNDLVMGADVASTVISKNGVPIVVAEAMYFNCNGRTGGSLEIGFPK